jgi:hypothetical protein
MPQDTSFSIDCTRAHGETGTCCDGMKGRLCAVDE